MQGVTAGVKLGLPKLSLFRPFVKGGVTFNNLQGGYGGSDANVLTTDKTPGYEVGVGLYYALLGVLSLTPQVRYVGPNLKAKIPDVVTSVAQGRKNELLDMSSPGKLHAQGTCAIA